MLDPEKQSGAFVPIAKQIAEDAEKLTDKEENWTEYAGKLDQMSLKAYLEQFRGKTDDWALDLLDVGYVIEFGLETEDQSSLNMVDFIGTDLSTPFQMFGESDQVFSHQGWIVNAHQGPVGRARNKVDMKLGQPLSALDVKDGRIVASFDAQGGAHSETFDAVILALPFTRLRQVKGLEGLELGEEKLKTIRELGYGTNAKILQGTTSRVWQSPNSGLPAPSNGTFYTDLGFQKSLGDSAAPSLATLASLPTTLVERLASPTRRPRSKPSATLPKMTPKMAESLDPAAVWSGSGPPIPTRSEAMPALRLDNTPR